MHEEQFAEILLSSRILSFFPLPEEEKNSYLQILPLHRGYNQHNKWFGDELGATPDGRYAGDSISFGRGPYDGRDKEGLTALMNSVAKYDEHCLLTGPSVTNMILDEKILTDDDSFEKFVSMIEAYFMMGGLHAQFNFVSEETLKDAKINPEKHKNLRVRVSGFSDYLALCQ